MRRFPARALVVAGLFTLSAGMIACDRDVEPEAPMVEEPAAEVGGAVRDAGESAADAAAEIGDEASAAIQTADIKTALMADDAVDADEVDVDARETDRTIVLRGSVATEAQRMRAAEIAQREAPGYRIDNQLTVNTR